MTWKQNLAKVFKHSEQCARLTNQGWSSQQLWMARGVIVCKFVAETLGDPFAGGGMAALFYSKQYLPAGTW